MPLFRSKDRIQGKHVLITGGSKGLGFALAEQFILNGCHVSIIARSQADLLSALQSLNSIAKGISPSPKIQSLTADTTNAEELAKAFVSAEAAAGPIEILICNAGLSIPGLFADQSITDFERQITVNYLGTVKTIKTALPRMLARRQGHIVIVGSMLSILGFAGYSSYAPSKWALRGLADCLRNELQGTGIRISIAYPPDTDTPGYQQENETKPALCVAVNDAMGSTFFPANKVAKQLVKQIEKGRYHLTTPDLGLNVLIGNMASLSEKSGGPVGKGVAVLISPIVGIVAGVVGWIGDKTAKKYNERYGYPNNVKKGDRR